MLLIRPSIECMLFFIDKQVDHHTCQGSMISVAVRRVTRFQDFLINGRMSSFSLCISLNKYHLYVDEE